MKVTGSPARPVISFENVSKTFPKELGSVQHQVFHDFSFQHLENQTLGLIGANGAGKTTCLKLLMDFIRPDKGEILLFNEPAQNHFNRQRVGYLPEVPNFPENLNVIDLLKFTARSSSVPATHARALAGKWLKALNLWDARKKSLRTYSKGMKQRASFAVALINDPELLILDEPMSGLDPLGRSLIFDVINELKGEGKTILFCSHILEDIDRLADSLLVLHHGEKLFNGPPATLVAQEQQDSLAGAFLSLVGGGSHD